MLYNEVSGDPFKIGYDHGSTNKEIINNFFQSFCISTRIKETQKEISNRMKKLERLDSYLVKKCSYVVDELKGMAKGCGLSYEDVLWVNSHEDIDYNVHYTNAFKCTNIVFCSSKDGPLLGKTNDISFSLLPYFIAQKIKPDTGYNIIQVSYISSYFPNAAINSSGLAYGSTCLCVNADYNYKGLPVSILPRMVLQNCETIKDAIEFMSEWDVLRAGLHITLVDSDGNGVVIGKFPKGSYHIFPAENILFCTNHILDNEYKNRETDFKALRNNSHKRYDNLSNLVSQVDRSIVGIKKILINHGNDSGDGAICQHGQDNMHTVLACIIQVKKREIFLTQGYPCMNKYQSLGISSGLNT